MNKAIILLGVVLGFVLIFVGVIVGYIMLQYLRIIFRRIDDYFDTLEAKEIQEFKEKL